MYATRLPSCFAASNSSRATSPPPMAIISSLAATIACEVGDSAAPPGK
jgi:hypothetical protein